MNIVMQVGFCVHFYDHFSSNDMHSCEKVTCHLIEW
jgi:hypothetical protein